MLLSRGGRQKTLGGRTFGLVVVRKGQGDEGRNGPQSCGEGRQAYEVTSSVVPVGEVKNITSNRAGEARGLNFTLASVTLRGIC